MSQDLTALINEKPAARGLAFSDLVGLCGLTGSEAADVLGVSHGHVRKISAGHAMATVAQIEQLVQLFRDIDAVASGEKAAADLPGPCRRRAGALRLARTLRIGG